MAEAQRRGEPGQTKSDLARSEPFGSTFVGPFPTDLGQESSIGSFYRSDDEEWQSPPAIADPKTKKDIKLGDGRKAKPSIFNRYSVFHFNNTASGIKDHEDYIDSVDRIKDASLQKLRYNPTTSALIEWTRSGKTNAVDYSPEDFLWCKNYGVVPNNYLVTLRRFPQPAADDLFDEKKHKLPDIARMLTWVDGEDLKWENVGLKWSHGMKWADQEADVQSIQASGGQGNETGAIPGGIGKALQTIASISDTGASNAARSTNPAANSIDPYHDKSKIHGPIDVIRNIKIRDKGLQFEQKFELKFEYQLRSIDGINPKIAFIDLISNILVCTSNKGSFWGGERRFYGGDPKRVKPFGDPSKLEQGDYKGYLDSLVSGLTSRVDELSKGKGFSIPEGVGNILKSLGGNLMSQMTGSLLDKMGRPGAQGVDSLLSGDDHGEWHVTVGNPANPIMSVGNLALTKTDVQLDGVLGPDDFPTKIIVTCSLEPARPRDRQDMMAMFSRNNRTYLTSQPKAIKYKSVAKTKPTPAGTNLGTSQDKQTTANEDNIAEFVNDKMLSRFPNHTSGGAGTSTLVDASANLLD
jgi:hypothetical protein